MKLYVYDSTSIAGWGMIIFFTVGHMIRGHGPV